MLGNTEITRIMVHNHVYADPSVVQLIHIVNISSDIDTVCPRHLETVDRGQNTLVLWRKRAKTGRKHEKTMPNMRSQGYARADCAREGSNNTVACWLQWGAAWTCADNADR